MPVIVNKSNKMSTIAKKNALTQQQLVVTDSLIHKTIQLEDYM